MVRHLTLPCLVLLILAAHPAFAESFLRVDSAADHRSYTIDTDATAVERALRPVAASTYASKLPAWLYPNADAQPEHAGYDMVSGTATATFLCGGTVEQVTAYYTQEMRANGFRVSSLRLPGNRGAQLTGTGDGVSVSAIVETAPGSIKVQATYAPRRQQSPPEFEAVWYDDRTGILRLRDTGNGDEYELSKRDIVVNNLNRAGGAPSEDAQIPSWLPIYPGADVSPKGRISWLFKPTAEFVTDDPIRQIYDYYVAELQAAGATIRSQGITRSGKPLKDYSAYLIAIKGDEKVEIRIGEVMWLSTGMASKAGPKTGIGVLYSVPRH